MAIQKIPNTLIADNAITATKIANGTLTADDIAANSITAAKLSASTSPTFGGLTVNSSEVLFDNTGGDFTLKLNTNAVGDKNEIIMGDSGTPLAKFGVGGTADDIITGSDGQDFNIGTAGGGRAINFSTDNFASIEMKLDGGNLLVGKTAADNTTVGIRLLGSSGFGSFVRDGNTPVVLNRLTSNGEILRFDKDSLPVGSIGTISAGLSIGSGDTGLYFESISNEIRPFNTTTNGSIDNAINLGNSTKRFKDLYLSGTIALTTADNASAANMFVSPSTDFLYLEHPSNGMIFRNTAGSERMRIKSDGQITTQGDILPGADIIMANGRGISFAATANSSGSMSSELLDDYEEGTWTPGQGSFDTWLTSPTFTATYTKVGRLVTIELRQTGGIIGWSANDNMTGLPFSPSKGSIGYASDTGPVSDNGPILAWTNSALYFQTANASEQNLVLNITYETTA
jgi:hypothetical protein